MDNALLIQVKGIVQGVGFRPFVYRLAKRYLVRGWVLNAADGVTIHAEGDEHLVDEFVLELANNAPVAAHVEEIDLKEVPLEGFESFEIRFSDESEVAETTLVSPDLATCEDCVAELFDPENRRYRYPFINCTNCGPRFTIIERLPYDRVATSMAGFTMCDSCAHEYDDPADRRFHAQPDACFDCGPAISWYEFDSPIPPMECQREASECPDSARRATERTSVRDESRTRVEDGCAGASQRQLDPSVPLGPAERVFARAVDLLIAGGIVAVKGLGGFHLVCDACNEQAVATLRKRKHREGKAFAVMMQDVAAVRQLCEVSNEEEAILSGSQRPIVLLHKLPDAMFVPGLADALPELGVMLPYTPVQHLLLHDFVEAGGRMLVMTSGNVHDEPIVTDDEEALRVFAGIADAVLGNNREILSRYDDSVVRVLDVPGGPAIQFVRRARGYSPVPLTLKTNEPADVPGAIDGQPVDQRVLLAVGPEQKNTFCLVRGNEAFVSQHIGDLENAETFDAWREAALRYETLFEAQPVRFACDKHPEYLSTKWVREHAAATGISVCEVQHHHAHIAAVMAEHGLEGPVCGIAFDGTGYGEDGAIWGGEVLLCNMRAFERFANFAYVPMPGGAACVKHPLRMAYGALWAFDLLEHPAARVALAPLGSAGDMLGQMIDRGINTPYTSSVGRLFDAASALLGICTEPLYEGEAAILLEAALWAGDCKSDTSQSGSCQAARPEQYRFDITKNVATAESTAQDTSVVLLDPAPVFSALLDDLQAGVPRSVIARRFHDAFVEAIVQSAELVRSLYGIEVVALGGGVFLNRYLVEHALAALAGAGFTVAINRNLPPSDGCISFGQAAVAVQSGGE